MKSLKIKQVYQNARGVTLVALVITIILVMIIAGVAIRNGLQSSDNTQLQAFFRELQIIQKRVDILSREAKTGGNESITYHAETGLYEDTIGTPIASITDTTTKQKIENLKNQKEIYAYTVDSYMQQGKIFQLDGIQNLVSGNSKTSLKWEDLTSNIDDIEIYNASWNSNKSGIFFTGNNNSYMRIKNPIKNYDQFTIELFMETGNWESWWGDILTFDTGDTNTAARLEVTSDTTKYNWYGGGVFASDTVSFNMALSTTHLITITVDDQYATLYDNGRKISQETVLKDDTTQRLKTDYINICNRLASNTKLYRGNIFAIRMYNYALAQNQVGKHYIIDAIRFSDQKLEPNSESANNYYYYTPSQLKKIGIDKIEQDVLINWETREVVSVGGFKSGETTYYRDTSTFRPDYQGGAKQNINFNYEDNILITGESIKKIEVKNLTTIDGKTVNEYEVKYKLKEEDKWQTTSGHSFQVGTPGSYEVQIVGNNINSITVTIDLNPSFKVKERKINGQWNYVISKVFGEYETYYYEINGVRMTDNTYIPAGKLTTLTIQVYNQDNQKIGEISYDNSTGEEITEFTKTK